MTLIEYLDALAGAGKTYAFVRLAHRLARQGNKVLVVQPSKRLIANTVTDELAKLPPVRHRIIDGDHSQGVAASIVAHFKDTNQGGEILFVTHSGFFRAPYLEHRERWIVLVDEVPDVIRFADLNLPENRDILLPHIEATAYDARYAVLAPGGTVGARRLRGIARNEGRDDVWKTFQDFAATLVDDNWSTFVDHAKFEAHRSGSATEIRLATYSVLKPSIFQGFKRVMIGGACFEESLLYRLWLADGVRFRRQRIKLRYEKHQNGHQLRILFATAERWSKSLRNRQQGDESVFSCIVSKVRDEFAGQPFLWMANKDTPDSLFDQANGIRLPNSPHGLNKFQAIDRTVVLSALNPTPGHFGFLESRGLSAEDVRTAIYRQAVYQAALRSSLRDPASTSAKTVIVMDSATAYWLANLFPGAEVGPLGGEPLGAALGKAGRPRLHRNDAARKAHHRRESQIRLLIEQRALTGEDLGEDDYPALEEEVRKAMEELAGHEGRLPDDCSGSGGTVFKSKFDTEPLAHVDYADDDTFIAGLRSLHGRTFLHKEDSGLISPAHFDPDMSDATARGLANVRLVRGVWLDNDGGDLSPDAFAALFPALRIACWNTFSSTPERPRWRAFIPTTQAMSKKVHQLVLQQIVKVLNKNGFWSKEDLHRRPRLRSRLLHGFDRATMTSAALFYLPCQAADPRGSFFVDFDAAGRRPLEPVLWIKRAIIEPLPEVGPPDTAQWSAPPAGPPSDLRLTVRSRDQDALASSAIGQWRAGCRTGGVGNTEFFKLAVGLRKAGYDDHQLEMTLRDQASAARHPHERRMEISRLVRSLPALTSATTANDASSRQPTPPVGPT